MDARIAAELELLRSVFPDVQHAESGFHWFLLPKYPMGDIGGWTPQPLPVAFHAQQAHPGTQPYGIYVPSDVLFQGRPPNNITAAGNHPPFPGSWSIMSWSPQGGQWRPTAEIQRGSNLLNWALGFADRFREGR
ncbi:MAG: hypothetical protein ACOZNI_30400 [Myxococcota bacterium]